MNITEDDIAVFATGSGERHTGAVGDVFIAARNKSLVDVWAPDAPTRFVALHFLTGLAQTALAPTDTHEWLRVLKAGGFDQEEAARRLSPYASAFDLDNPDGMVRRFQPAGVDLDASALPLASLHLCEPSGDNVANGVAFFQKAPGYQKLGPWFALLALYGAQCVHPPGGGGYYNLPAGPTALRTVLVGRTLFETVWLNVMPQSDDTMSRGEFPPPVDSRLFPWLAPEVSALAPERGEKGTLQVPVETLHPAAVYWSAGRRYVLISGEGDGVCDLSGLPGPTYSRVARWSAGLLFTTLQNRTPAAEVGWKHPLALRERITRPDGDSLTLKAHYYPNLRAPLRLDDWARLYLIANNSAEKAGLATVPPPTLRDFVLRKRPLARRAGMSLDHARVEVGGYFSTGKVVHGWTQKSLPVDSFPDAESAEAFTKETVDALVAGDAVADRLSKAVKAAGFGGNPEDSFWGALDADFADLVSRVRKALGEIEDDDALGKALTEAHAAWRASLRRVALSIFDTGMKRVPPAAINQTIANARRSLAEQSGRKPKKAKTAEPNDDPIREVA